MAALDTLDDWPVPAAAAAVVGPSGVLAGHGDTGRQFALASVTKLLVARAAQIAIEEGAVELDTAAGPPGSTVRHLLAHASGLAMHSGDTLARPGTRRIYSNYGFAVLAETVQQAAGIEFGGYLAEAVLQPLGMTATRLDGGAPAAGFGVTSTVADLAAFARDLLTPTTVSAQMHAEATTVQFPGLNGVLPGYGQQRPNDWGLGFEIKDADKLRPQLRPFRPIRHVYLGRSGGKARTGGAHRPRFRRVGGTGVAGAVGPGAGRIQVGLAQQGSHEAQ
jgi:CubicO group peptidase (beta-lactamase class C family)